MNNKVYIDGFSYKLGEKINKIEELEEIKEDKSLISQLKQGGLVNYHSTDKSPFTIAKDAINLFFDKNVIARNDIDAVIFSTNSFWSHKEFNESGLSDFLMDLELNKAYPIASSFSFCSNFLTSIRTAYQYVKNKEFNNVLVVVSDRLSDETTRLVPPNISIGSDAASCCLVSSNSSLKFELKGISQSINVELGKVDPDKEFTKYMQGVADGVITNINNTLSASKVNKDEINMIVPNNYNKWIAPSMAQLADFPLEKVNMENISRFAHAGASDICINLADIVEKNNDPEKLLLLSSGPMMWATAILQLNYN